MDKLDNTYCMFDPSEIRTLAMHATDLYFASLPEEKRLALTTNPLEFTKHYAKIYAETIRLIEEDMAFREYKHRG